MNEFRTHTCGELRESDIGKSVVLSGWVQRIRHMGALLWVDVRDRFGITQLTVERDTLDPALVAQVERLGKEYVVRVSGEVRARFSPNPNMPTGAIEIIPTDVTVLNAAKTPPFLIEDQTDGGDELRMEYRYLDLRRNPVRNNLLLRHATTKAVRSYLNDRFFVEVETPMLIKSTPEGARDFVVPSRLHPGSFYALPQSPQTFKQLLMVAGLERYYQITKCFRDEALRADRQPEFTQIDCEMSFVTQEDILVMFEGLVRHVFLSVKGITLPHVERMTYADAMRLYGNDKPDTRFGMTIEPLSLPQTGFALLDNAETILTITVENAQSWSRKQIEEHVEWAKRYNSNTFVSYARQTEQGISSPLKKFHDFAAVPANALQFVVAGSSADAHKTISELRLRLGDQLGLRPKDQYKALWVTDFPLLEYSEEEARYHAMHHPFTAPNPADAALLDTNPAAVRAQAYDLVINGVEVGGGSIRIHNRDLQQQMFGLLGFTEEQAHEQFGFLMGAFEYGAPPHGGLAFGLDRLCAILGEADSIRDFIAFPKNNAGRDTMINAPAPIDQSQLDELGLK